MRSASSPPTVGSTTTSNSVVITSMPASIARLAMPRSARGTRLPKLRLQRDPSAAGFAHHASATGNLTIPGEGMDAATLARAGEPFFTTKGVGKGTGLGLPMVHGFAQQSGGRLVLKSRKGKGTTAELWLPVAPKSEVTAVAGDKLPPSASSRPLT